MLQTVIDLISRSSRLRLVYMKNFRLRGLRSWSQWCRLVFLLSLASPCFAQSIDFFSLQQPTNIAGKWKFQPGDDPRWAQPQFNDDSWHELQVPQDWGTQGFEGYTGFAWYRISLQLCAAQCASDPATAYNLYNLAVTLGKVVNAYEIYAGGELLGGRGELPPTAANSFDQYGTYRIPRTAIDKQGRLVLALRVWRSEQVGRAWESGPYDGPFLLGETQQLTSQSFYSQLFVLIVSSVYLALGCYHCYLYTRYQALTEMFWFGVLAINVALYSFLISQWRFSLPFDPMMLQKIEFGAIFLMASIAIEFTAQLLAIRVRRGVRWYQYSFVALAMLVVVVPGLTINYILLTGWQVYVLPAVFGLMGVVSWQAWLGNTDARKTMLAFLVCTGLALLDLISDMQFLGLPALLPLGFVVFMLSMPVALGDRITRLVKTLQTRTIELDDLQKNLELTVEQRTEELRETNKQLERVAHIDPLTEVANRRAFLAHAENEIAWARRSGKPFALIVADIDHFKLFNDEFGHACGDFVLAKVALTLSKTVRATDMFARWGGEEFVFILRETDAQGALELAEKCRLLIEQKRYIYCAMELAVTMTLGVSEYQSWMTIKECMEEADDALYFGKAAGRNTVARSRPGSRPARAGSTVVSPEIA